MGRMIQKSRFPRMLPAVLVPACDGEGPSFTNYGHQERLWRQLTNPDPFEARSGLDFCGWAQWLVKYVWPLEAMSPRTMMERNESSPFCRITLRRAQSIRSTREWPAFFIPSGRDTRRMSSSRSSICYAAKRNPRCKLVGFPRSICVVPVYAERGAVGARKVAGVGQCAGWIGFFAGC